MIWAHSFGPGPNGPILRFCHEWGQNKRWGAVRHVKRSGILIRVVIYCCSSEKLVFRRLGVSCWFRVFETFFFSPKVTQKCPGPLWDHPRPIWDHFRPIFDKNRLTHYIIQNRIKHPIQIPLFALKGGWFSGLLRILLRSCLIRRALHLLMPMRRMMDWRIQCKW